MKGRDSFLQVQDECRRGLLTGCPVTGRCLSGAIELQVICSPIREARPAVYSTAPRKGVDHLQESVMLPQQELRAQRAENSINLMNRKNKTVMTWKQQLSRFLVSGPFCFLKNYWGSSRALGFHCASAGKESACSAGDPGSVPELGRSPGEGKGYPL